MSKEIITFGGIEIGKRKFHNYKNPFFLKKKKKVVDLLISNKISSGEKNYEFFIRYMDDDYEIKDTHREKTVK